MGVCLLCVCCVCGLCVVCVVWCVVCSVVWSVFWSVVWSVVWSVLWSVVWSVVLSVVRTVDLSPVLELKIGREFSSPAILLRTRSSSNIDPNGCRGCFLILRIADLSMLFTNLMCASMLPLRC